MIKIDFWFDKSDLMVGFCVKGHAYHAPLGQDIVCAAVSSSVLMAANTITEVLKVPAEIKSLEGFLSLKLKSDKIDDSQAVLKGLKLHLLALSNEYPKQIKVKFLEV